MTNVSISPFLICASLALLYLRERNVAVRMRENADESSKGIRRLPPDERIIKCIEAELSERPKYILDLGSGFADRARQLAEQLMCTVVAFESNAQVSIQAAEETKNKRLVDSVWHVRCDPQLSVDAQDVIEGKYFDAVIVSARFARRRGALAWAALALREGGVMIAEGDLKVYDMMRDELGLEHVRIVRGGTLASIEEPRKWLRQCIAASDRPHRTPEFESAIRGIYRFEPYLLIVGSRTASLAPLTVRPRTLSAITFTPSLHRSRQGSKVFEKPPQARKRDDRNRRLRVASVCVLASSTNPHRPDFSEVVLVSSSKKPGDWIVPAGGLEDSEAPDLAALREATEESGAQGRVIASLGMYEDHFKNSLTHYFLILVDDFDEEFPEKSKRRVILVDIEDAIRAVANPGSKNALKVALDRFSYAS